MLFGIRCCDQFGASGPVRRVPGRSARMSRGSARTAARPPATSARHACGNGQVMQTPCSAQRRPHLRRCTRILTFRFVWGGPRSHVAASQPCYATWPRAGACLIIVVPPTLSLWVTAPVLYWRGGTGHARSRCSIQCLHVAVFGQCLPRCFCLFLQVIEENGGLGFPTDSGITSASVRTVDGHLLINGKNAAPGDQPNT